MVSFFILTLQYRDGVRRRRRLFPTNLRVPASQVVYEGKAHLEDRHPGCQRPKGTPRHEDSPPRHEER